MYILLVVAFSGGVSSSNFGGIEFTSLQNCTSALNILKSTGEMKLVQCVKK